MWQSIIDTFNLADYAPHGYCLKWNPVLLWTLVGSDALITLSYFSIPFAIWYFAKKRPDLRERWLLVLFGLFIIACGITHLLDVLTIWEPNYWLLAFAKFATAALSSGTAIIIWRVMPTLLRAPSIQQLERAKADLENLNAKLEQRVQARTEALAETNDRLETERARLRGLIDNIPDYIFIKDTNSVYLSCNKAVEALFGVPESEIIGKTDADFVDLATADLFRHGDLETLASDGQCKNEELIEGQDGRQIYLETIKVPFKDDQQRVRGLIGVARDITERRQAERKLQLAAQVFSHAREGIMITDSEALIVDVNATFTEITGYSRDEVIGQNPRMFKSGRQSAEFYSALWDALGEKGHWYGEVWNRHKSGRIYAELITISAVTDEAGQVQNYVALFTDITQIKEHQRELEHIAHYDALTCLPNRVLLTDRMRQAMIHSARRNRELAVVYLDLDGFKAVNDNYDHHVGDELLIQISQRMKQALREGDTLARIGGDEFIALLVDLKHVSDCEPVLERLLQAASSLVVLEQAELRLSASIGITLYPQDNVDADLLIRHADQAMYFAKQQGKNRYHVFDIFKDVEIKTRRAKLEDVRSALAHGEFVLYYQPKVNFRSGDIIGAEALIRWQHPEHGQLNPADFLPVLENDSLAVELGEWAMGAALAQLERWADHGLTIPVSVNIGATQLQQADFVARISEILALHPGSEANGLELEILETSALEDLAAISEKIKLCRDMGLRFALDDFGTGFSSLTYLRHLPVDIVKIDQSFVRDMLIDPDDLAIVKGVIALANNFSREVIAEGVESIGHANMLLSIGCERVQGYGIARPMPADEMPAWVNQWRSEHQRVKP
jgi:diguanylate cyclase (GGDEF)-like protein/PAS domain S-box-containing protein